MLRTKCVGEVPHKRVVFFLDNQERIVNMHLPPTTHPPTHRRRPPTSGHGHIRALVELGHRAPQPRSSSSSRGVLRLLLLHGARTRNPSPRAAWRPSSQRTATSARVWHESPLLTSSSSGFFIPASDALAWRRADAMEAPPPSSLAHLSLLGLVFSPK